MQTEPAYHSWTSEDEPVSISQYSVTISVIKGTTLNRQHAIRFSTVHFSSRAKTGTRHLQIGRLTQAEEENNAKPAIRIKTKR